MLNITELIVRAADLAEAEGRILRAMTVRVALGIGIIIVGAAAITAGVALVLAAVYIVTADKVGAAAGAAVTGVLALAIGGFLAWLGHKMAK